jgi:hypothetical protein
MFTTIITDCKSQNAKLRQITRFTAMGLGCVSAFGINSNLSADATVEAGANLIDALDASDGKRGLIFTNVAPRGKDKETDNGSSFCYFWYKDTLVISTVEGYCLYFVNKFRLKEKVGLINTDELTDWAYKSGLINSHLNKYLKTTQFRSYDLVPKLAVWILKKYKVPFKNIKIKNRQLDTCVWCVDAFGNCKLTATNKDLVLNHKKFIETNKGKFYLYKNLKDVPKSETAIYVGSSGLGDERFLEIATQKKAGSAAARLNLKVGERIDFV